MAVSGLRFTTFLTLMMCYILTTAALVFNLSEIGTQNQNKEILTGGAGTYISGEGIHLTSRATADTDQILSGRATYAKPLHLWDSASGQLADFSTNFSFVIDSDGATEYGDGFSFFLAENNSFIGAMGLPVLANSSSTVSSPFVAVEFDTYWDKNWDPVDAKGSPIGDHVGIDINSLISVEARKWWSNVTYGRVCVAKIKYDATSQNFTVTFTGFLNDTIIPNYFELHYTVDLRTMLPEWVIFGFTASSSTGLFQSNIVKSWSFNSSDPTFTHDYRMLKKGKKKTSKLVLGCIVGFLCVAVFLVLLYFLCRRRSIESRPEDENNQNMHPHSTVNGSNPRAFTYVELVGATGNFNEGRKIGAGGFGAVYEGVLPGGMRIAVKIYRVSATSQQGFEEYEAEVQIVSGARHRHLVQLIGWCNEIRGQPILIYEFMANKSLNTHLFNSTSFLSWEMRHKIARGLATAVRYLHEDCGRCVLHRDIKSSNVLLDSEFNPKLGDFGLAKLVDHDKSMYMTVLAGTRGYLAPECWDTGRVSKESDVYSFGVVALELATGRKAIDNGAQESQIVLVDWIQNLYKRGRILDAVDPKLGDDFNKKQMEGLIIIGLWCVIPDPKERLTMIQVVSALNDVEAPLSNLPRRKRKWLTKFLKIKRNWKKTKNKIYSIPF